MKKASKFSKNDLVNIFAIAVKHGCSSVKLTATGELIVRYGELLKPATNDAFSFTESEPKPDWGDEAIEAAAAQ